MEISERLIARVSEAARDQAFRVLLVLAGMPVSNDRSRATRQETIRLSKARGKALMPLIDELLATHGGKLLDSEPSALGTLSVETTADGVRALTKLPQIHSIIEDQNLLQLR